MKISKSYQQDVTGIALCYVIIIWGLFPTALSGQELNEIKTNKITLDDFSLPYSILDPNASAFIIHDVGNVDIHYTPNDNTVVYTFQRATRLKIVNEEGLTYANISIPLELPGDARLKLSRISGATYLLEDGKIEKNKLNARDMIERSESNLAVLKIKFPQCVPGAIVDLTYTLTGNFLPQPISWLFQYDIPALLSQFSYAYPEYIRTEEIQKGYIPIAKVLDKIDHLNPVNVTPTDGYGSKLTTSAHIFIPQDFNKLYMKGYQAVNVPPFKAAPHLAEAKNQKSALICKMTPQTAVPQTISPK